MKTIYDLMTTDQDEDGSEYPVIQSFPLNKLEDSLTATPLPYKLKKVDCQRIFDLIYNYYNSWDSYYEDIVLMYNDIEDLNDYESLIGTTLYLPKKEDLDKFYQENIM